MRQKKIAWRQLSYTWLLALLVFVTPTHFFLKIGTESAYINGLLVDYLIPKLYPSDFIILGILSLWLTEMKLKRAQTVFIAIAGMVALIGWQVLASSHLISWWWGLKLALFSLLGIFLYQHQNLLKQRVLTASLVVTLIFQSVISLVQFFTQQMLAGYWLFGEPDFHTAIGLAKGVFDGAEMILPYGTTAHPNVLAGFIVVFSWLILGTINFKKQNFVLYSSLLALALAIPVLWFTQSWTAWLAVLLGLIGLVTHHRQLVVTIQVSLFLISPWLLEVISRFVSDSSVIRRVLLNRAAIQVWLTQPILGVGLQQFTTKLEIVTRSYEVVRFVQPAHHVGLLWLAETGGVGLSIILAAIYRLRQTLTSKEWQTFLFKLALLLPFASFDHYLVTLQTGLLLSVLWLTWPLQSFDQR